MTAVILSTLAMMAATFLIGFAVAYLVKFISIVLAYFDHFSISHTIRLYKRFYHLRRLRQSGIDHALATYQSKVHSEMLDYFYPNREEIQKQMNSREEQFIIFSYHGNH